MPQNKCLVRDL